MKFNTLHIPLAAGLNQKSDPRAMQPPGLTICKNVEFDELGGLQTRKPFAQLGTGTPDDDNVEDFRRIVPNGNELLAFTKDALWSWSVQHEVWTRKGTHLAVTTEEESVFATTGDQTEAERGELDGVIVYAWTDPRHGVYAAAVDKETGAVVMAPTYTGGDGKPRIVVLDTRILLFVATGDPDLVCYAIDPASPDLSAQAIVILAPDFGTYFDACRVPGADQAAFVAMRAGGAAYTVGTVDADLTIASSNKARTAGVVAIACTAAGDRLQIVRVVNGVPPTIIGDLINTTTLADVYTDQAIGVTGVGNAIDGIAAAFRSTQDSGVYRCYVYWAESVLGSYLVTSNWVSTGNTLGAAAVFNRRAVLGSRAFEREGSVYVWLMFASESTFFAAAGAGDPQFAYSLQNTYFLVRDDGFLVAKAAANKAGGVPVGAHLPTVSSTGGDGYAFCGIERRVISIGGRNRSKYGARVPRDVRFEFDSNEARRCARIGQTLYIGCGEGLLQYDGAQLTETGFHVFPYTLTLGQTSSGSGLPDGTYAVKMSWRWDNARGEMERSTTATVGTFEIAGGPDGLEVDWELLPFTHKTDAPVVVEVWRTQVNPTADSPFYLATNKDPTETSNPNRYLENPAAATDGDTLEDELEDVDIAENETHPENGQVLECLPPPPAKFVVANADRLFLAGVAGDPDRVWYSRLRNDGEVASFHDALTVAVPREGGAITGLGFLNETLIVFRETAAYALPGDGYDNTGGGGNYGPARIISAECGAVSQESIALTPGGLVFKSSKGWYLMNRGWALDYIGGPVSDYDDEEVMAVQVVESQHQVRCLTESRMLVLDYLVNQWGEWTISEGLDACIWRGQHLYLRDSNWGPYYQRTDFTGIDYGLDVETAWIKLNDLQGAGRVRKIHVLGECRGAHYLRVRLARNYETDYFQDKPWEVSPTDVGGPLQVKHGPSIQRCQAIKVRLTVFIDGGEDDWPSEVVTPPDSFPAVNEALKLTGLGLEVGIKEGLWPFLPSAQKQ